MNKRVRSYINLTIKFHDYSSFFTAFDVATITITFCILVDVVLFFFFQIEAHIAHGIL